MVRIRVCGTVEEEVAEEMRAFHSRLLGEGKVGSFSDSFEIVVREGLRKLLLSQSHRKIVVKLSQKEK